MEDTGEVVERHDPRGYAVFEPGGRMMVVMATAGISPPRGDAEAAALFDNMTAYTGRYCVEGNRLTVEVDVAWHPDWEGTEQIRFVDLDGDRLTLSTGVQEHPSRRRLWGPSPGTGSAD
jgi:hypothetical protein